MQKTPWVAYVGAFNFPYGQAGSRRVFGVASSLIEEGFNVFVGSGDSYPREKVLLKVSTNNQCKLLYQGLGEIPPKDTNYFLKSMIWFYSQGERTIKWIKAQKTMPSCVILYNAYAPYTSKLLNWCRDNKIPLINDVVEWYDPRHVSGGIFGPFNFIAKYSLIHLYPKGNGIIAISSFLADYYRSQSCNVIQIPPTLDTQKITPILTSLKRTSKEIVLAYSGIPGKKDLINNVIEALFRLENKGKRIRLIIAGQTSSEILRLPAFITRKITILPQFLQALGPQSHETAMGIVRNADFMPLLRPPHRYAQAGFPTKVPESLSVGTPIICNLTSDLEKYIRNGKEGIICQDHSIAAFENSLDEALSLSTKQRTEMRYASRRMAELHFDFRAYSDPLANYIRNLEI